MTTFSSAMDWLSVYTVIIFWSVEIVTNGSNASCPYDEVNEDRRVVAQNSVWTTWTRRWACLRGRTPLTWLAASVPSWGTWSGWWQGAPGVRRRRQRRGWPGWGQTGSCANGCTAWGRTHRLQVLTSDYWEGEWSKRLYGLRENTPTTGTD